MIKLKYSPNCCRSTKLRLIWRTYQTFACQSAYSSASASPMFLPSGCFVYGTGLASSSTLSAHQKCVRKHLILLKLYSWDNIQWNELLFSMETNYFFVRKTMDFIKIILYSRKAFKVLFISQHFHKPSLMSKIVNVPHKSFFEWKKRFCRNGNSKDLKFIYT